MDINSKSFSTMNEFKSPEMILNSKPLAIISPNCIIKYSNLAFETIFCMTEGGDLGKLESDLQLNYLIEGFAKSKYNNFNFDLILPETNGIPDRAYKVDVERALIENQTYFILQFNSIEEQKKIEDRIYYLINAIEYGKVAIIILDKWGFVKYTSKSSEEILKNNIEQLYNSYLPDALSNIISAEDAALMEESIREKKEWQCLSSVKDKNGETQYRKLRLSPVQKHFDTVSNFILTFNDVTEHINSEEKLRKAFEKENQLNRLKSAFMANMSHEIRTPSTAIIGFANLLRDDVKAGNTDNIVELVDYLDEGINRLVRLFDNIIEVSLLESGEFVLDLQIEDVNNLIKNSCSSFYSLAEIKGINFNLDFSESMAFVAVDKMKFNKIVDSLIDNAIKYNKKNGNVTISTRVTVDYINIVIADTGRGIEKNKIEAILQPFIQEEFEGHKRTFEGAGLGLTVAYKLTKALKGDLNIMSRKGEGTSIFLKFPLAKP